MLDNYLHLLREAVKAPAAKVSDLEVLPESEKSRLLTGFNPPSVSYDRNRTLWDLFEESAKRTPDKPAVLLQGKSVSYAELAAAAKRVSAALAKALALKPQKPGFPVALCVDRGVAMIAGMLGILRSGG